MSDESMDESMDESEDNSNFERNLIVGKIYMIHLENFLTHSEAKVFPHELLNIVIGPNGTGKSSLVAGVIIGMGGSTKILSAHNKLSDYVKNGKKSAKVTLILFKDEQRNRKRFCREFGRDNKSIFSIDGQKVSERNYLDEVCRLNIQVGNLCQFLPQERVQDFAKQNPQELFLSTLKSVCSDELIQIHGELKDLRNNQLNGTKKTDTIAVTLQENERRVELLKPLVDEIMRQDQLVERKDLIEKKLAWIEAETMFVQCREIEKELKVVTETHTEAIKSKTELVKSIQNVTNERNNYEKLLSNETKKKNSAGKEVNQLHFEFEKMETKLNQAKKDLQMAEKSASEQQQNIDQNRIFLGTYEKELSDCLDKIQSVEAVQDEMKEFDDRINVLRQNIGKLENARRQINERIEQYIRPKLVSIDNRISSMNSEVNAKLNFLHKNFPDVHKAVMWLREHKDQFQGKIYEPLILEINVRSPEYCKYIENTISTRDLVAFTCEDVDDMNSFIKIMRVDMKLGVNILHSQHSSQVHFSSTTPINEVRKIGGEIYLIDCIEAPVPIVNYLCQTYRIHNILIGNENIERKFETLPDHIGLIFSPANRIQIKRSKFSGQKSSMLNELKSKDLLNVRVSKREMSELQTQRQTVVTERDKYYNKRNEIEVQINAQEADCADLNRLKNKKHKDLCTLKDLENKVKQQTNKLNRVINEHIDIDVERENFNQMAAQLTEKMFKMQEKAIDKYSIYMQYELEEIKARARLTIFKNGTINYEVKLMEKEEEIARAKAYCDRIGTALDEKKRECKNKRLAALELTNNRKPSEGNDFPFKQQFDELSNDKDELMELKDELEGQINCRTTEDQQTLNEYNERLERIERLKNDYSTAAKSFNSIKKDMEKMHRSWYPQISAMITSINRNFSRFMTTMGCAGEVELIHPEDIDYDKYGIEIRVKYRNSEQLRPLDRFVQSGGERAVAIAVYSLSLQHLSQVPFRCVDEINQGMDPINERRIFEMLVNNVAQNGQSQFFYVTPKLQQNMPFNENTSCLTVFNGSHAQENDFFEDA